MTGPDGRGPAGDEPCHRACERRPHLGHEFAPVGPAPYPEGYYWCAGYRAGDPYPGQLEVGCTVITADDYAALPVGAVVRSMSSSIVAERVEEEDEAGYLWMFIGTPRGNFEHESVARRLLEALVLWMPERAPDTASANTGEEVDR